MGADVYIEDQAGFDIASVRSYSIMGRVYNYLSYKKLLGDDSEPCSYRVEITQQRLTQMLYDVLAYHSEACDLHEDSESIEYIKFLSCAIDSMNNRDYSDDGEPKYWVGGSA